MREAFSTVWEYRVGLRHILVLVLLFLFQPVVSPLAACPNPPQVTISPQQPADVCIPSGFGGNPIAFFDDFSWRSFIAMVWPVLQGSRGVPDTSKSIGPVSGPLVFETFKADWEMFQPSPNGTSPPPAPAPWNTYAGQNPCSGLGGVNSAAKIIALYPGSPIPIFGPSNAGVAANIGFGDVLLASFSKFGNLGLAGFGNLVGSLPAQNGTFTRYSIGYNKTEFDQILAQGLYLRSNLPTAGVTFQNGATDVKAAWIDMANVPHPERYYTRAALVLNPFTTPKPTCTQITVGLVGLHIVQKTPSRPQWIWSTFEQIDNVPGGISPGPFAYNNGSGQPMPASNPDGFPPPATPKVFNVQRLTPINPSTMDTNKQYQSAIAVKGGPWQFYQLVMTQWPLLPNSPQVSAMPANTFPGSIDATSAFANVTLETFDQTTVSTGCMACHEIVQGQGKGHTDFLFSLSINAFPSTLPPPSTSMLALRPSPQTAQAAQLLTPQLQKLKEAIETAVKH